MKSDTIVNAVIITLLAIYLLALVIVPMADNTAEWYVVTSSSMEPTLNVGDMVYVSDVDPDDVEVGDIITFKVEDYERTITHRCVEIIWDYDDVYFRTKGDANEENDTFIVYDENIVGRVGRYELFGNSYLNKIPRLGYLSYYSRTKLGYLTLILIPGLAIIGLESYNILYTIFEKQDSNTKNGGSKIKDKKKEERFKNIYQEAKMNLNSIRNTHIKVDNVKNLIKEANGFAKNGDYDEAIIRCEKAIDITNNISQIYDVLMDMKIQLKDMKDRGVDYHNPLELLKFSKNKADRGDYDSALYTLDLIQMKVGKNRDY